MNRIVSTNYGITKCFTKARYIISTIVFGFIQNIGTIYIRYIFKYLFRSDQIKRTYAVTSMQTPEFWDDVSNSYEGSFFEHFTKQYISDLLYHASLSDLSHKEAKILDIGIQYLQYLYQSDFQDVEQDKLNFI